MPYGTNMFSQPNWQLGTYRLLRRIGSGGMGEVYLAEDTRMGIDRQVAIKMIRAELDPYPDQEAAKDAIRLFQREMQAVSKLDHPYILPLYDFGEEKVDGVTITYMVMPYRPEGSLANWLAKRDQAETLSLTEVEHFISQAAQALQYAHSYNLVHQDVKPANFLIRDRPDQSSPDIQLADFGIVKITTGSASVSQSVRGTPAYMAPEQWLGKPVAATDQYALAIMAYGMLTRRFPFTGSMQQVMRQHLDEAPDPPNTYNPALSPALNEVILTALHKAPEERFESVGAFATAFKQAIEHPEQAPSLPPQRTLEKTVYGKPQITEEKTEKVSEPTQNRSPYTEKTTLAEPQKSTPVLPEIPMSAAGPTPANPFGASRNASGAQQNTPIPPRHNGPAGAPPYHPDSGWSSRERPRPVRRAIFASIIAIVVIAGIWIGWRYTIDDDNQGTSSARATATEQASADKNPCPVYVQECDTSYRTTLQDPLTTASSASNWQASTNNTNCAYTATGNFLITSTQSGGVTNCTGARDQSNFVFSVNMVVIQGDCGGATIRFNQITYTGYLFIACASGSYEILKYTNRLHSTVLASGSNAPVTTGNNILTIGTNGNELGLYINRQTVTLINDSSFLRGSVGLVALEVNNETEIVYKNAHIWS